MSTGFGVKKFTIPGIEKKEHWHNHEANISAESLGGLRDKMRVYYSGIINAELCFFEPSIKNKKP